MVNTNNWNILFSSLLLIFISSCVQSAETKIENDLEYNKEKKHKSYLNLVDTYRTTNHLISVYNGCTEGNVSCGDIKFIIQDLITNETSIGYGSTKHLPCKNQSLCVFNGYEFAIDNVKYEINLRNEYLIVDNLKYNLIRKTKSINNDDSSSSLKTNKKNEALVQKIFGSQLHSKSLSNYHSINFSNLLYYNDQEIIGILGDNYKRLIMKIGSAEKDTSVTYKVTGYSQVKNNSKTKFKGLLTLNEIYSFEELDYGVDDEYKDKGILEQSLAVFNYELQENSKQKYSGSFKGQMYLRFYKTNDGKIYYDDISLYSDGYFNRLYSGTWLEYGKKASKIASWADYTLPDDIAPNLNIGAGEFVPNPDYYQYGWQDYNQ